MELTRQVFSSSDRKSTDGYSMYNIKAPTLSEDEDDDAVHDNTLAWDDSSIHVATGGTPITGSFVPAIGGPFSALTPSMWPQDLLSRIQQTEDAGGRPTGHYDEFGFMVDGDLEFEHKDPDPGSFVTSEDEGLRLKWTAFLEFTQNQDVGEMTWDKVSPSFPHSDKLRELVYLGIPHSMRAPIWMRISGALQKKISSDFTYKQIVRASADENSLTAKQIEKDLLRTMPNNACFSTPTSTGLLRLRRILRSLAWLYTDIGYCQGMGMIVASLLLFVEEEDAFWLMCTIVEDLVPTSYYSSTLIGVQADQRVLRQLIVSYLPPMDEQLKEHDIELSLITLHWFLTAFASVVHTKILLRVWDIFLYEGSVTLFRITLGMLKMKEDIILKLDNSAQIFNTLSDIPGDVKDADELLEAANKASASLTDVILETHRKKHMAFLMADLGVLMDKESGKQMSRDRLQKRTIAPPRTFFSLLFGRGGGVSLQKAKNIRQTELVADLREAILQIARHFDAIDPKKGLEVDYSMESHARDHERFINVARNRRRRAKALLDFERHDDDELGFRKNDIVTIISQKDEHCWVGELNGLRGWFPAKFVEILGNSAVFQRGLCWNTAQFSTRGGNLMSELAIKAEGRCLEEDEDKPGEREEKKLKKKKRKLKGEDQILEMKTEGEVSKKDSKNNLKEDKAEERNDGKKKKKKKKSKEDEEISETEIEGEGSKTELKCNLEESKEEEIEKRKYKEKKRKSKEKEKVSDEESKDHITEKEKSKEMKERKSKEKKKKANGEEKVSKVRAESEVLNAVLIGNSEEDKGEEREERRHKEKKKKLKGEGNSSEIKAESKVLDSVSKHIKEDDETDEKEEGNHERKKKTSKGEEEISETKVDCKISVEESKHLLDRGDKAEEMEEGKNKKKKKLKSKEKVGISETKFASEGSKAGSKGNIEEDNTEERKKPKRKKEKLVAVEMDLEKEESKLDTNDVDIERKLKSDRKKKKKENEAKETSDMEDMDEESRSNTKKRTINDVEVKEGRHKAKKKKAEKEEREQDCKTKVEGKAKQNHSDEETVGQELDLEEKKKKKKKAKCEENDDPSETNQGNGKEIGKSDEKSSSQLGQWGRTEFGSDERRDKFLRLMGAYKNKPSTEPSGTTLSSKSSRHCMTKVTEDSLTKGLEQQYESAMNFSRNRRGLGLGYNPDEDPSNKLFYIDKTASKSVKLN